MDNSIPKYEDSLPIENDTPSYDASEPLPSYANGASPTSPLNQSPVSAEDKLKLSFGNEAGNIKYLKQRFEEISKDKDGSMVVKDQGVWHRVDPKTMDAPDAWATTNNILKQSGLSDKWQKAAQFGAGNDQTPSEFRKNVAGLVGPSLPIAGGMIGSALAGPAGSITGAGVGEGIKTSLGRLVGTYDATPAEQVKDIAKESLLAAGGEVIAAGVKPTLGMLRKSLQNIGDSATNFAKEQFSSLWGESSGAGRWSVRRAIDDAPAVIDKSKALMEAIGPSAPIEEAKAVAAQKQAALFKSAAIESKDALQKTYGRQMADLVQSAPENFKANTKDVFKSIQDNMVQSGLGTIDENGMLKVFSEQEALQKFGAKDIGEKTRDAMLSVSKVVNKYAKAPDLEGREGVKKLLDLKKSVGESFEDFYVVGVPDNIKRAVSQVKQQVEAGITQQFANAQPELAQKYITMNADYSAKKDAVDLFYGAAMDGKSDSFVKKLVSKDGINQEFKEQFDSMTKLLGDSGKDKLKSILDYEAAKGFIDPVFHFKGGNSAGTLARTASTVVGGANNPKLVGRQIAYGSQLLEAFKSMTPPQLKQVLSSDELLSQFIRPVVQAYGSEDQDVETLLKKAGVK